MKMASVAACVVAFYSVIGCLAALVMGDTFLLCVFGGALILSVWVVAECWEES